MKSDARLLNIGATVRSGTYWNYTTFITPVEEFYIRNHYPTPTAANKPELDPKNWKLRIHGKSIARPLEISYEELIRMPSRTIIATLECHGNARTLFWEQQDMKEVTGGNWTMGAIGQAEWQYVPIGYLLERAGVARNAKSVLFWSGIDGSDMGRPMPASEVLARADDIGVCYRMNGNDLTPDHGAPVRLVVPGWGGTAWIKWLTEIRVDPHQHWCRLNTRGEVYIGPDYPAPKIEPDDEFIGVTAADVKGPMVTWMPIKTTLTVPLVLEKSPNIPANYPLKRGEWPRLKAGPQTMTGYAWAPQHGIRRVEYRIDGGPWMQASIVPPNLGRYTWVRFTFPWNATPGDHIIETRGTDMAGNVQPERVPFNQLGMANGAIPRFKIRVVA
ncbi:MAG: molybdopterin-dependent oxidoreductase [Burkholderiaceae bacterium]|nr:molybdopterin-dependent oxidoreductase [Burkholderiaceae bacterium]